MKFIISPGPVLDIKSSSTFQYVELNRKKELSEPITIAREDLLQRLLHGEEFRTLYKVDCRWEIGQSLEEGSRL